ncbi:MAG: DNA circularization N-terminal domain-containing protein [Pseudomonadota bacterium]
MAWRDQWQTASFRGVVFRFRSAAAVLGRRNVVHSFPGRDEPYVEDMGRKAREFTLEAFVLGDDYIAWRDRLEAACEQAGPGELVHPTRGRMLVAVQDCRPSESVDAGGMASYSLTFIEAGSNAFPSVRVDTQAAVTVAADDAITASVNDFADKFSIDGKPSFVAVQALADVNAALDTAYGATLRAFAQINVLPGIYAGLSTLKGQAEQWLSLPATLGDKLSSQVQMIGDLFEGEHAYEAGGAVAESSSGALPSSTSTPARAQATSNTVAVSQLMQRSGLVVAARAAAQISFASSTDALAVRDSLADRLEAAAETASDDVYFALMALRAAVVRDIGARAADLARLMQYTPRATIPAVVLAYQLYGDATRADEIVARNHVRHAGFVPGGEPLEVLANG